MGCHSHRGTKSLILFFTLCILCDHVVGTSNSRHDWDPWKGSGLFHLVSNCKSYILSFQEFNVTNIIRCRSFFFFQLSIMIQKYQIMSAIKWQSLCSLNWRWQSSYDFTDLLLLFSPRDISRKNHSRPLNPYTNLSMYQEVCSSYKLPILVQ